jgi:1-acyl-sn-glycerol-3-phosphate acyltransferase
VIRTIFVARGEVDRQALGEALALLKAGEVLGVAPEGTRSRTGGLLKGRSGIIYLAGRAGVPIVPAVMWGQEQVMPGWIRLRRANAHLHIGPPICLPPEATRFRTADLDAYTEQLMLTLARMLPAQYRGVYSNMVDDPKV